MSNRLRGEQEATADTQQPGEHRNLPADESVVMTEVPVRAGNETMME
jgi:hypothetical protein